MEKNNKSFYERAKELAENCKSVKDNNVYEILAKEFNIGKRTAGNRFKSLFGKPVRDYISDYNIPTKEQLRDAIIRCDNHVELVDFFNINPDWLKGLYDKYFGISTFTNVKLHLLNEFDVVPYNPTIEDNLSILISQKLGDGYFDFSDKRNALKIEHGYKQFDYLKFKVNLLKKAFPTISGIEKIKKRNYKGYISYSWYSNNIRHRYLEIIKNTNDIDLIDKLTPLGWMLWYLDDGSLMISKNSNQLSIAIHDNNIRLKAIEVLRTYGFSFSNYKEEIVISHRISIIKFLNCFIKPFIHLIPECMKYKCIIKI